MNRKIPVLHIRDSSGIFGAERVLLTLGKNIDRDRFDFKLLCMRRADGRSNRLIEFAQKIGVEVYTVDTNGRIDTGAIRKIRKILKRNDIRIIHSHDFKSDFYSVVSSAGLNIYRVTTAHGSTRDSILKKVYLFWDEKVLYRSFNRIVSVSEDLQMFLAGRGVPVSKISIIPNGLDFELLCFSKGQEEPLPAVPPGHKIFAVVGRLYPDKGHRFFLEALSQMARKQIQVFGLIVGDGPANESIRKCISEYKIEKLTHMCGIRSDMQAIYDRIDCLVIPSLTEGLPYVLLEAMANHVPVIATTVGDIPRLIDDRHTGYLVPPGDSEALAERMSEIVKHFEKTKKIVGFAHQRVQEHFSAESMVRRTENMYLELLN